MVVERARQEWPPLDDPCFDGRLDDPSCGEKGTSWDQRLHGGCRGRRELDPLAPKLFGSSDAQIRPRSGTFDMKMSHAALWPDLDRIWSLC